MKRQGHLINLRKRKFKVVFLTPDIHIDRRIAQMCFSLIKHSNVECLIIKAFNDMTKYKFFDVEINIRGVEPENNVLSINKVPRHINFVKIFLRKFLKNKKSYWLPKNFEINLDDFYWLHSAFLEAALKENADLYIACDLPVLPAGVIAAKTFNVPLIYDAHELYSEQVVFDENKKKLLSYVENVFIKYADAVITVNESIAQEMSKRYSINKPFVILNAINSPKTFDINKNYNHLRKNLHIDDDKKIVLYQGGFSPYRNLENLVKSAKYVREGIVTVLMGFGDYEKELKSIAKAEGLLNRKVFFHPAAPQEILLEYSASADVGIIPYPHVDLNGYYCTPNKLFEFIQAGLPILANESPELKRFVERYNMGIIHKLDSEKDIADGINCIFSKDLNIFHKNLLKAREEISWKIEEKKFLNLMEKFVEVKK